MGDDDRMGAVNDDDIVWDFATVANKRHLASSKQRQ